MRTSASLADTRGHGVLFSGVNPGPLTKAFCVRGWIQKALLLVSVVGARYMSGGLSWESFPKIPLLQSA